MNIYVKSSLFVCCICLLLGGEWLLKPSLKPEGHVGKIPAGLMIKKDSSLDSLLSCPADTLIFASGSRLINCDTTYSWPNPLDSLPLHVISDSTHASGSTFSVGSTRVAYWVIDTMTQDSCGCDFLVILRDTFPPDILCTDVTRPAGPNTCEADIQILPSGDILTRQRDNCSSSLLKSYDPPLPYLNLTVGSYSRILTVTDQSGNSSSCSFQLHIEDRTAPRITNCPINPIFLPTEPDTCGANVNIPLLTYSDNCDPNPIFQISNGSGFYGVGLYPISATVSDSSGNSDSCLFYVQVYDNQAPDTLFCPGDISVAIGPDTCERQVFWQEAVFWDNCALVTVISTYSSGDIFRAGSYLNTYTARDAAGNSMLCHFQIVVQDTTPPILRACPTDTLVLPTAPGLCYRSGGWAPPWIQDNCASTNTLVSDYDLTDPLFTGIIYQNTYVATDPGGNQDSCTFWIQVVDREAPVIQGCPPSGTKIVQYADVSCNQIITLPRLTFADNCGVTDSVWVQCGGSEDPYPGSPVISKYPFTACATLVWIEDGAGNRDSCTIFIEVKDTLFPYFTATPPNDTLYLPEDGCEAIGDDLAIAADNCGTPETSCLPQRPAYPIGTYTITCTAKDGAGNTTQKRYTIVVEDTFPPQVLNCPDTLVYQNEQDRCGAVVHWDTLQIKDNCSPLEDSVWNITSGSFFPVGETLVSFIGTDEAGNMGVCEFVVVVEDTVMPVITACEDQEVIASLSACRAPNPGISTVDNCSDIKITYFPDDTTFGVGIHLIQVFVEDIGGNRDSCEFELTVLRSVQTSILNRDTLICRGAKVPLKVTGAVQYVWSPAYGLDNIQGAQVTASPRKSITYEVEGTDGICSSSDSVHIEVFNAFTTRVESSDLDVCEGETIELRARGGVNFIWFTTGDTASQIIQNPTMTTTYEVMGFDENWECDGDIARVRVEVFPYPKIDFLAGRPSFGQPPLIVNFDNITRDALRYQWTSRSLFQVSTPSFAYKFRELGTYEVQFIAIGENDCRTDSIIEIHVIPDCWNFANAFTPNSDGINDYFVMNNAGGLGCGFSSFEIQIFDRWGNLIFRDWTPAFSWDGSYKGRSAPEGVYTVFVHATDYVGRKLKRQLNLQLIR